MKKPIYPVVLSITGKESKEMRDKTVEIQVVLKKWKVDKNECPHDLPPVLVPLVKLESGAYLPL